MSIRGSLFIFITIIAFIATFRKPKIGLFYFLLLLFLRDGYLMENIPEVYRNWHVPLIAGWIILISWFFWSIRGSIKLQKPFELFLMVSLGLAILISAKNASIPKNAMDIFNDYIRMFILVFLIVNIIRNEKDLRQISILLISLITFLVAYAYYRYKIEGIGMGVPSVYYTDPNFFAESIVAILPLAFAFYEDKSYKMKRYIFLGVVALMSMGVIITNSRGGLLALLIVLLFLFINSKEKIRMLIMGSIILVLFLPHIGSEYKYRVSTVTNYEEDPSAMGRIASWDAGINMVLSHPVIGVGAGNFNALFESYRPPAAAGFGSKGMSIHNMFLQIFSETGMVGGGLFILIIISSFITLHRLKRKNKSLPENKRIDLAIPNVLGVSLIGFCGAGFFLPGAYYSYIYIIFALIMVSKGIYFNKMKELEK